MVDRLTVCLTCPGRCRAWALVGKGFARWLGCTAVDLDAVIFPNLTLGTCEEYIRYVHGWIVIHAESHWLRDLELSRRDKMRREKKKTKTALREDHACDGRGRRGWWFSS